MQGMIAVSPDRKKIASVQSGCLASYFRFPNNRTYSDAAVALYDFDAASGMVSNPLTLFPYATVSAYSGAAFAMNDSTGWGVCFSPDNSKLYYSTSDIRGIKIYQFDLSLGNSNAIVNSRTLVGQESGLGYFKLASNGKIYICDAGASQVIRSIEAPNLAGTACQFVSNAFTSSAFAAGLPNVISVFKRDTIYSSYTISDCHSNGKLLSATDTSGFNYIWNDGSYGAQRTIDNGKGTYWVQYHTAPCVFHTDTFAVKIGNLPTPVIRVDHFNLSTTQSYDTYQWLLNGNIIPGATNSVYTVTENGDYTVAVSDRESGCTDTSTIYKITNVTSVDRINRLQQEIKIYPNPSNSIIYISASVGVNIALCSIEGRTLKYIKNATRISMRDLTEGIYFLQIYDRDDRLIKTEKIVKIP